MSAGKAKVIDMHFLREEPSGGSALQEARKLYSHPAKKKATRDDVMNFLEQNVTIERFRNLGGEPDLEGQHALFDLKKRLTNYDAAYLDKNRWTVDIARWLPITVGGGIAIQFSQLLWFIVRRIRDEQTK